MKTSSKKLNALLVFLVVFMTLITLLPQEVWAQEANPTVNEPLGVCINLNDNRQEFTETEKKCDGRGTNWLWDGVSNKKIGEKLLAPLLNTSKTWWDSLVCTANPIDCGFRNFAATMSEIILRIVSLITMIGGVVLNGAIFHTVVNVSENYNKLPAINEAWRVIRDVANMAFIFVLLYAGIQTMLGIGKDTQRLIVRVVVVAVLINFSLFFTKFVIDISNVLALTFYDAMVPAGASGGFTGTGLSDAFMKHLNLQGLYALQGNTPITFSGVITVGVMGSIMLLVAAFVFFAVGILFVLRYVVLIMLLILSPIAFIAFILPQAEQYRKQWWDALSGQAFFAPVYMMLTWVTLKILSGIQASDAFKITTQVESTNLSGSTNPAGTVIENTSNALGLFPIFIDFIVVIAFLIFSLVIAKDFAGRVPGGFGKVMNWATGVAGGATLGLAGKVSRQTIGRAGQALGENEWLKKKAIESNFVGKFAARKTLEAGRATGGSSFDVRATGLGGTLSAGKAGGKGGFADYRKKKAEKEEKFAKSLGPSDEVKDKAKRELELAQEEEKKVRVNVAQQINQSVAKPAVLENLEKNIRTAKEMSGNTSMTEAGRRAAAERVIVLTEQARPIREAYETKKKRETESLISSSGITQRVQQAQERVDQLAGPSKERKAQLTDEANSQQKKVESADPAVIKQKELEKNVEKLTKQIETAAGSVRDQLNTELETRKRELEMAKEEAGMRRSAIRQEFDERRKAIKDMKGEGDIRKSKYAEVVRGSILGKLGGYNQAAAAKIRGSKSTGDKAKDLIAEMEKEKEGAEEKPKEEKTEEKPAEGGGEGEKKES